MASRVRKSTGRKKEVRFNQARWNVITERHFTNPNHQAVYELMKQLEEKTRQDIERLREECLSKPYDSQWRWPLATDF